MMLPKFNVKIA